MSMNGMNRLIPVLWMSTVLFIFAGCSRALPYTLAATEGKVTIDGKPAENILVTFVPSQKSGQQCPTSTGTTDDDGLFKLATIDGRDGAVVGKCSVTLIDLDHGRVGQGRPVPVDPIDPEDEDGTVQAAPVVVKPKGPRLPAKYNTVSLNGLTAEVEVGGDPIVIDVKSK